MTVLGRWGALLLGGYGGLFLLLHAPVYRGMAPGVLAAVPGYLAAAAQWNPLQRPTLALLAVWPLGARLELLAALALLFAFYLGLLRAVRRGPHGAANLRGILAGAGLCGLPLLFLPYLLSQDVYSYILYGRIGALYGANPALVPPAAFPQDPFLPAILDLYRGLPSVYGPVWLLFSQGLTLLVERAGGGTVLYLLAYKGAALGAHLASAALIWSLLGRIRPADQAAGTLLYAWNPLALIEWAGSGHNDVFMLLLILAALWWAQRSRRAAAILALVGAALVKWVAGLLVPLATLLWLREQPAGRARRVLAAQLAGLIAVGALLPAWPYLGGGRTLLALLASPAAQESRNTLGDLVLRGGPEVLHRLGIGVSAAAAGQSAVDRALAAAVLVLSRGALLGTWVGALAAVWRRPTLAHLIAAGFWLLLLDLLLATLWFWPWYTLWPLALAALLPWRPAGRLAVAFTLTAPLIYVVDDPALRTLGVFLPMLALLGSTLWRQWRMWNFAGGR